MNWFEPKFHRSVSIPFAYDSKGQLRDVAEEPRGLACRCVCPDCRGPLVAKKGKIVTHHFSHHDRRQCRHALEASLFSMVTDILGQPGASLALPGVDARGDWVYHAELNLRVPAVENILQTHWVIDPEKLTTPNGFKINAPTLADCGHRQGAPLPRVRPRFSLL